MSSEKELLSRGLPKWPGLLVVGNPVSLEQAEEIIIRTARLWLSFNIIDGIAVLCEPDKEPIGKPTSLDFGNFSIFSPGGERGCTIKKFKHALETTLSRMACHALEEGKK